jgi:hypothetical protein
MQNTLGCCCSGLLWCRTLLISVVQNALRFCNEENWCLKQRDPLFVNNRDSVSQIVVNFCREQHDGFCSAESCEFLGCYKKRFRYHITQWVSLGERGRVEMGYEVMILSGLHILRKKKNTPLTWVPSQEHPQFTCSWLSLAKSSIIGYRKIRAGSMIHRLNFLFTTVRFQE